MDIFPYKLHPNLEETGIDAGKLNRVIQAFTRQHAAGAFPGGQLAIRKNGKLALNFVIGVARNFRPGEGSPVKVRQDTSFIALSTGKPIAAVALAMLEARGKLDVSSPVVEFIPEFALHGKENITILDVLTHQAGIILPDLTARPELWGDREVVLEYLIQAKPVSPRGRLIYAAYEYGWLLSEIFLRVEGRALADFIADEISAPLGLPALQYGLAGRAMEEIAHTYWLGKDKVMVSNINVADGFEKTNNSIEQINSMNPAVSLVTDAASLAAFYEFLLNGGVTHTGEQLISPHILRKYTTLNKSGWDRSSRTPMRLGRGFMLGSKFISTFGWSGTQTIFGHGGGFSSLAYADPDTNSAVAILTNGNRGFMDMAKRFLPLAHKIRLACK